MTTMPARVLGTTGMRLSTVGLGTWAMGGPDWRYGWGPQDDAVSAATIRHAVASGLNWLDTAAAYGRGHAEEVVGRAIADIPEPERPFVFTKCGLVWDDISIHAAPRRIMNAASVRQEIDSSLRRLRVERIDLYQVHQPADGQVDDWGESQAELSPLATPLEEYWQTMADLRAEGKVWAIGLSNHDTDQLRLAEQIAHVDAIQPQFSVICRDAAAQIRWARDNGTGVIAYQPLHSGLLSGGFSVERVATLPDNDWRRRSPEFTTNLSSSLAVASALGRVAKRHAVPAAAVAVAWVVSWPGITAAIAGARHPAQVDGWHAGGSLRLGDKDWDEIAAAIAAANVGTGPNDPRRE